MGSSETVMVLFNKFREGIVKFDMAVLGEALMKLSVFALGAIIGLKSFSKILHWMFEKHKNTTYGLVNWLYG